jgi:outer membrane protein OmpA-like peptidoglycan-associated protein
VRFKPSLFVCAILLCIQGLKAQDKDELCPLSENKKANKLYEKALDVIKTDKNEARGLLKEAIEIEPDFARASWVMADLLHKQKKFEDAEPYLRVVTRVCPEFEPLAFFRLGSIEFEAKKWKEAAENLQKFVDSRSRKEAEKSDARAMIQACRFYIEGYTHPVPFNPNPLAAISTDADEYLPIITPDNETAYFTRSTFIENKFTGGIAEEKKRQERFTSASNAGGNSFAKGTPMPAPFNSNNNEGGASLSADNKFMFFTICKDEGGDGLNCDLWYTMQNNGGWEPIKNAGPVINGKDTWDSQPSLSSDGKTLYFASNRTGGLGGIDIWKSEKDAKGNWKQPENLGPKINTSGNEKSPFFHSDGQTLYFSSTGHLGYGGYDIYLSKLSSDTGWSNPKNIGYPINSEKDDLGFFVSTDGKYGYFASDKLKGNGGWDVYSFELYKEARPERVLFVSGALKDENNQIIGDAKVEIKNARTKEVTEVAVDSATGKYVAVVAFNDDHIITVKQPGKAFTSQYFSKSDTSIGKPMKMDLKVETVEVGKPYRINNIYFKTSSALINAETVTIVGELTEYLTENKSIKIAIHGHTDNVGNAADNLKLSDARAKTVYDLLILNGIQSERLSYKGFGASKPVASNLTEKGKALNRRTEFVVTGK